MSHVFSGFHLSPLFTMTEKSIVPIVNKLLAAAAVLAFLALPVTGYLTYMHYAPEASDFCTINETINCDIVNKSQWSYLDLGFAEIPVAIMGFMTYLVLFIVPIGLIANWPFQKIHKIFRRGVVIMLLRWLAVVGTLFSLYLTYIEAFVLHAWCVFCVAQQILILAIAVLFFVIKSNTENQKKDGKLCEFC